MGMPYLLLLLSLQLQLFQLCNSFIDLSLRNKRAHKILLR